GERAQPLVCEPRPAAEHVVVDDDPNRFHVSLHVQICRCRVHPDARARANSTAWAIIAPATSIPVARSSPSIPGLELISVIFGPLDDSSMSTPATSRPITRAARTASSA